MLRIASWQRWRGTLLAPLERLNDQRTALMAPLQREYAEASETPVKSERMDTKLPQHR
jgi:hypothetical protein